MEVDEPSFHLRAELRGHEEDVRGVCSCELGVLTTSRDKTVRLWAEDAAAPHGFTLQSTMVGHTDFVGPVIYVAAGASPDYPQAVVVSGSRDKTLRVWDPSSCACLAVMEGHQYQVTALGLLPTGELVSASLDKTLRVWRGGQCVATWEGHEGPVLCLAVLPSGDVLSGSGDTTVRMWSGGKCVHVIQAHSDTVRGMCLLADIGFVTGSHDMSCKVWDSTGSVLAELVGHSALVYAVAALRGGASSGGQLIASGSEDNTARVWRPNGECLQVIPHPGNIWALDFMPSCGDLLTGCSDSVARVWSRSPERAAPAEVAAALASTLEQIKAAKEAAAKGEVPGGAEGGAGGAGLPPGLKVEDAFVLSQPGSKDGENKFVREAGSGDVVAYAWDAKGFQWEKIGVVVEGPAGGAAGGGGGGGPGGVKKFWAGQEWDYVFDVDIEEGALPKKLAMNASDNPYIVADRFIEQEQLPPYFKEQIVQFITQNTGGGVRPPAADLPVTGGFCDPFTGGSSSSGPPPGAMLPRPPMAPLSSMPVTGGGVDPFTGGGSSGASASRDAPAGKHVPCHVYLAFDNPPNMEALARKLREVNGAVAAAGGAALTEGELAPGGPLEQLLGRLPQATTSTAGVVTPADAALLLRLLSWPAAQLFPALDLARLAVLDPKGAELLAASAGALTSPQPGTLAGALHSAACSQAAANHQLALRLACNCFKHAPCRAWLLAGGGTLGALMDAFAPCAAPGGGNKAVRLSLATLLGNVAAAARLKQVVGPEQNDVLLQALSCGIELMGSCPALEEADAVFRCLVAMGTMLQAGGRDLADLSLDLGLNDAIRRVMESSKGGGAAEKKLLEAGIEVTATIAKVSGRKLL